MEITVEHIKKRYGKKRVLNDISFMASEGDCVGIVGGNGCGKSTLLSIMAGVLKSDGGRFLCDGENLLQKADKRSEIVGYIPQNTPLIEELTALDNLRLWSTRDEIETAF